MIFFTGALSLAIFAALIVAAPLWRNGRRPVALASGVFVIGMTLGVYLLIGRLDLGVQPPAAATDDGPRDVIAMVEQLAQRLQAAPDDPEGWTMLGRAYVLMGRYADAAPAFSQAMNRTPGEDADLIASYAEARTLADPGELENETGLLFERVLELDPENPRGLWYGGLRAQALGDNAVALSHWKKLLARDLPADFRQVVEARIAAIDPAAIGALLSVTIDVAPALAGALPEGGVLYVFLRPAGEPAEQGPPLAARRAAFFEFPQTLPLTEADLLRGDTLGPGDYRVSARVSADGDPAPGPGDIEGVVQWNSAGSRGVELLLDTRRGE